MAVREKDIRDLHDYKKHIQLLKDNLPYLEHSLPILNDVLKEKKKLLNKYDDIAYELGQGYSNKPLDVISYNRVVKARDNAYWKIDDCNNTIRRNEKYISMHQPSLESYSKLYKITNHFWLEEIHYQYIRRYEKRIDVAKTIKEEYLNLYNRLDDFLIDIEKYKKDYEYNLVDFKNRLKSYEQICEHENYQNMYYNNYLGFDYQNLNEETLHNLVTDYGQILDDKLNALESVLSKQVDVIIDENEDYRLVQCANGSMEIRDYDDELVAETEYDNLDEALEELQNENDLQI